MVVPSTTTSIDEEALRAFLVGAIPGFSGDDLLEIDRVQAGHSNLTYKVLAGTQRLVLRRPPAGPLPPSAHDMLREYRILERLARADLRIPRPVAASDDTSIVGAPFYLMELVDGIVTRQTVPPELADHADRRALSADIIEMMAELHAADWKAIGLDEVVPAGGDYLRRQIRRWQKLWVQTHTREVPHLEQVGRWIEDNLPHSHETTIVHGDFKLDNILVRPGTPPRCTALLDWELSTIGDPLADLGWLMMWWVNPGESIEEPLRLCMATHEGGFMTRDELRALYEERTGRDTSRIGWYQVFGLWRLAILFEGSYKRHLSGTADDEWFAELETGVPYLIERARQLIDR
jgi:aminoglycoside phosphotransferase (APT) family kinase protein